jgi:hypothetical protein
MLWILIGYMFLFIHRPFEIWPILGDLHVERLYALGAILAVLVYSEKRWIPNRQHLAYAIFAAVVLFCWIASPWAEKGQLVVEDYFKILIFYILFMAVVHDEAQLRKLLLAFLAIMFIYMLHSLREYACGRFTFRMSIARMIGVDKSLGDPNSFGASIVYALPFVGPFWLCSSSRGMKAFLAAYVGLSILCIGLTGSRSAFVGLLLWGLLTVFRSKQRWSLAIGSIVLAPILWFALPASLQDRFETIIHPEVGPVNAIASGQDRIEGLLIGFELWGRNPVTGVGPGAWKPATRRGVESHNLYGQIAGELGTLGLLAFLGIVVCFYLNLRTIRKAYRARPEWGRDFLYYVSGAIGLALVLLLFEGNFGHNLFRFTWLWYGGFLIIARYCIDQRLCGATVEPRTLVNHAPAYGFGWGYQYG